MIQTISRFHLFSIVVLMMSCLGIIGCHIPPSNGSGGSHVPPLEPKPDKILQVGDKFPTFSDEDVRSSFFDIYIDARSNINENIVGGTLQLENGQMKLKDGTVYKVLGKCIIDYSKGGIITEGTIEVYHNKR